MRCQFCDHCTTAPSNSSTEGTSNQIKFHSDVGLILCADCYYYYTFDPFYDEESYFDDLLNELEKEEYNNTD